MRNHLFIMHRRNCGCRAVLTTPKSHLPRCMHLGRGPRFLWPWVGRKCQLGRSRRRWSSKGCDDRMGFRIPRFSSRSFLWIMEERIEAASEEGSRRPALRCFANEVEMNRGENMRRVGGGLYPTRTAFHPRGRVQNDYRTTTVVSSFTKNYEVGVSVGELDRQCRTPTSPDAGWHSGCYPSVWKIFNSLRIAHKAHAAQFLLRHDGSKNQNGRYQGQTMRLLTSRLARCLSDEDCHFYNSPNAHWNTSIFNDWSNCTLSSKIRAFGQRNNTLHKTYLTLNYKENTLQENHAAPQKLYRKLPTVNTMCTVSENTVL